MPFLRSFRRRGALALALGILCASSAQAGGFLGIDNRINIDNDGIWARKQQHRLMSALIASEIVVGLWEGGESRLGQTNWRAIDATLMGGITTEALKHIFRRERPSSTDNPNAWFRTGHDHSFPSGEVTMFSAAVTPFILEYREDHPWVYALAALPLYDGYARMKTRGHWQTDVLAGMAIGTFAGFYTHGRRSSFTLGIMPHGIQVGLRGRF